MIYRLIKNIFEINQKTKKEKLLNAVGVNMGYDSDFIADLLLMLWNWNKVNFLINSSKGKYENVIAFILIIIGLLTVLNLRHGG